MFFEEKDKKIRDIGEEKVREENRKDDNKNGDNCLNKLDRVRHEFLCHKQSRVRNGVVLGPEGGAHSGCVLHPHGPRLLRHFSHHRPRHFLQGVPRVNYKR